MKFNNILNEQPIDECSICWEECSYDMSTITPCYHVFHKNAYLTGRSHVYLMTCNIIVQCVNKHYSTKNIDTIYVFSVINYPENESRNLDNHSKY